MERTIRVTGKGKLSVKPDTIVVTITLTDVKKEYEAAVSESAEKKALLTERLLAIGFAQDDLKTVSYQVDTEYESYEDENHIWKQRRIGYRYRHMLKLTFPMDNERLGKVLYVFAHAEGEPEFRIAYTVAQPELVKETLLAAAVSDARRKAQTLADAADVKMGEILNILYSFEDMEILESPMPQTRMFACKAMNDSIDPDITPDDISVQDTVTVIWAIQ